MCCVSTLSAIVSPISVKKMGISEALKQEKTLSMRMPDVMFSFCCDAQPNCELLLHNVVNQ